jgi:exopolysaccharide biosynthesis WecB/TagA/CpsF family protein
MARTSKTRPATAGIHGIAVTDASEADALGFLHARIEEGATTRLAFLNAHCANVSRRDPAYRSALGSFTVLADGIGVDIAARVLNGAPFKANLNGTDFVPALLRSARRPMRVALIGGRPGTAVAACNALRAIAPSHLYFAVSDGFFGEDGRDAVLRRLENVSADVVLVAMGVPTQERFIAEHLAPCHGTLFVAVGALFDFLAGNVPRAPRWVRAVRSEWIWRLCIEPRRMAARYLMGNPAFLLAVAWERLSARGGVRPARAKSTIATAAKGEAA